jgi:putative addiction module CopG family antidote
MDIRPDSEDRHMPYQFPPDVDQLVRKQMASGSYTTEDELLREALRALREQDEDLLAVREALAEFEAGDAGVPLDEAFDDIRQRHAADPKS